MIFALFIHLGLFFLFVRNNPAYIFHIFAQEIRDCQKYSCSVKKNIQFVDAFMENLCIIVS